MSQKLSLLICLFCFEGMATGGPGTPVTTGSLIREMVDLRRFADFPDPTYRTVQFSSYDRRSRIPEGPQWFANSDGFGREPTPNFEEILQSPNETGIGRYLICDVSGPGAIVRTWTAAIEGAIRLYLDGASDPIYQGPAQDFLLHPYRHYAEAVGLDAGLLEGTFYQRNAAYCPIPFAKRCRIEWVGDPQKIHFYQIQVRQYGHGTAVTAFRPEDLTEYADDIRAVAAMLRGRGENWAYHSSESPVPIAATLSAGESVEALSLSGGQALERLTLKVHAGELDQALRQTILHIVFDDHRWGQVQAPLGDFFGAAPGVNPYDSVPFSVSPDGTMTCRFFMPFKTTLRLILDNRGAQTVTVTGSALPVDYEWNDSTSMHFRARWRVDHDLVASNREVQDLPFLLANGQGVYVGTAVMLLNPTSVPTPGGGWWGEGDEKVFIDDDVEPSTFGTGSEDYFNYAWSEPDIFVFPYCGQPRNDGPGNRGFVTNHRWQILDPLPFQRRIAFYMELFSHERTPGFSYARIAYHYARPGVYDDHLPITNADVRALELPEDWQPAARGQARDSLFYQVETLLDKPADYALLSGRLWAGGQLFVWYPRTSGERVELAVPVPQGGRHSLHLGLALDNAGGSISVKLDGENIGFGGDGGVIDLQAPHRTLLRQYSSGPVELTKGSHVLEIRSLDTPVPGTQKKKIGIDYLAVKKLE